MSYLGPMELPVSGERLAQLQDFARRRGKDTVAALDEALAEYLDWERQDSPSTTTPCTCSMSGTAGADHKSEQPRSFRKS